MRTIFKKDFQLTPADHQTHLQIPFELKKDYNCLHFHFSYSPKWVEDSRAVVLIEEHLKQVIPESEMAALGNPKRYLPLENLITLSLDYEQDYIGCHHCKDASQHITISERESTKGFIKQAVQQGNWLVQLNMHCVQSEEVHLQLAISVE